jgi:hypothetical protein
MDNNLPVHPVWISNINAPISWTTPRLESMTWSLANRGCKFPSPPDDPSVSSSDNSYSLACTRYLAKLEARLKALEHATLLGAPAESHGPLGGAVDHELSNGLSTTPPSRTFAGFGSAMRSGHTGQHQSHGLTFHPSSTGNGQDVGVFDDPSQRDRATSTFSHRGPPSLGQGMCMVFSISKNLHRDIGGAELSLSPSHRSSIIITFYTTKPTFSPDSISSWHPRSRPRNSDSICTIHRRYGRLTCTQRLS